MRTAARARCANGRGLHSYVSSRSPTRSLAQSALTQSTQVKFSDASRPQRLEVTVEEVSEVLFRYWCGYAVLAVGKIRAAGISIVAFLVWSGRQICVIELHVLPLRRERDQRHGHAVNYYGAGPVQPNAGRAEPTM